MQSKPLAFNPGNKKTIRNLGIRQKLIVWLSAMIFFVFVVFSVFGYLLVLQMREQTVGEGLQTNAKLIAISISRLISHEIQGLRVYFRDPVIKERLEEMNKKYEALSFQDRENFFGDMDRKWADPPAAGLETYLDKPLTKRLKIYADTEERMAEVFVTDRYGGLVASSGKTTDFFQADEVWWNDAFHEGKGRETVRDAAWDDSSGVLSINLAMPVKDGKDSVIGIAKQVLNIRALFKPLQDYHIGKTGHAVLINATGDILFHQGIEPFTEKFYNEKKLQELFLSGKKWVVLFKPHSHKEEMFVAFAKVESPFLEANGVHWYVFVDQSKKEIFAPLWRITLILEIIGVVFFLIFLWLGYVLSGRLVRPLRDLSRAADEIRKGNWDYPIDVRSGDEIQELAESFRYMVGHLRQRQTEILKTKEEIEVLSQGLEKKVEERTRELTESQLATINILEDLTEANEKLKKYTEDLSRTTAKAEMQSFGLRKANSGMKALYRELETKNLELEKLDQLKNDFVSIVAHELRNPLGIVREAAALILDGLAGPVSEEQKKYIEMIKQTGDRLVHITTDLLDLAKIEAGKIVVNYERIDLLPLIKQSCEGIALRANKKGLTVSEDFPHGKLEIMGDFDKLSQVMVNLLSNALNFTKTGGISVEVKDLGEEVRCAVKDTGPGISQENISKLFNKFVQFGKETGDGEKGSGLGLVIAKSIIEAHGGRMGAESELGKGSTFFFVLPKKQKKKQKLGEILLEEKTLTPEQLDQALRKQREQKS